VRALPPTVLGLLEFVLGRRNAGLVLGFVVGFFGLIPLIGATLGASITQKG
jgi:predicted PurR-regulated permease PerM